VLSAAEEWVVYDTEPVTGIERLRAHFTRHAYARHAHETYAIGMTETGSQSFTCRGVAHATRPGAIMLFNPTELHDGRATTADGFAYRMLYVEAPTVRGFLAGEVGDPEPLFDRPMAVDPETARLVALAYDALAPGAPALERDDVLLRLLLGLARRYGGASLPSPENRADRAMLRIRDRLRDAPGEDVTLQELADLAGMSRFHLTRLFQRRFGLAPSAYLRLLRLERAKRMLTQGEPPASVAASLGFADQAHLTRRFKAAYGMTPGRYRESRLRC
jgi:AraC-like DNA-binding protein